MCVFHAHFIVNFESQIAKIKGSVIIYSQEALNSFELFQWNTKKDIIKMSKLLFSIQQMHDDRTLLSSDVILLY